MRPPKLPRISTSIDNATMERSPTSAHSRNSSVASNASNIAPLTSNSSLRSHQRWPSSSSSLSSSLNSPINGKLSLADLVEEPAEIEEDGFLSEPAPAHEDYCICDIVFCKHQQNSASQFPTPPPSSPEWLPGDDLLGSVEPMQALKRQRSREMSIGNITSRLSRRLPSISSRWRDRRPTTSISSLAVRSAPPSRTPSARHRSLKQSLESHLEPHETMLLFAPREKTWSTASPTPSSPTLPEAFDIPIYEGFEDPIDRKELASTPLLPPLLNELQNYREETLQSPLQSPSVASPSTATSFADTPLTSPIMACPWTPPLSAKASVTSFHGTYSNYTPASVSSMVQSGNVEELEYLTLKLGHANIHVLPEPYMPERCDQVSCDRLLADWEAARIDYMNQAYAVSTNYGPNSGTYKLNSEKWKLIDRQWELNVAQARAEAEALGETPKQDVLAETKSISQMPSLPFDPSNPEKFPSTGENGPVGPMVQFVKPQRTPSKKKNFLKLLLEPAIFLTSRSSTASRQ